MKTILTRSELQEFAEQHGLRPDWHEPYEQEVTAEFSGFHFDNASCSPGSPEAGVYLLVDGKRVAYVNLALLFAMAAGTCEGV